MTDKEKELLKVFNDVFRTTHHSLEIERANMPEWDSMKHIELVIALQKRSGKKLNVNDVINIKSLRDFLPLLSFDVLD